MHVDVGDSLTPSNPKHDGCATAAECWKDRIEVKAEAYGFVPGLPAKSQEATGWTAAGANRSVLSGETTAPTRWCHPGLRPPSCGRMPLAGGREEE